MFSSFVRDSGATYSNFVKPSERLSFTTWIWDFDRDELRKWAMPSLFWTKPRIAST